ncbi:MAG: phenylalanine--tRNA ligase subunit beta [Candidatus Kerfeldbacteria bacterium]|nr:phenylalanine--tRNA ligase subunit beta [Candidatus Kerfeldbacteria bacterium]
MLLPLSWLKEFLPRLPPTPKLVATLMMHGLEVEQLIDRRGQFEKFVVGKIVSIKPHPNADKLQLAEVVTKPGDRPRQIVCGAPNIAVGQKVPVALVGAKLANGQIVESRTIRGVQSGGMICAEDELGLGYNHAGVLVLDTAIKVGTPLGRVLGASDVILDLAIPANRADLLSVRGLAREIGTILGTTPKLTSPAPPRAKRPAGRSVAVQVLAPKQCPVYMARVIHGVTLGPSPAWLQQRLRSAGMRPINAVVDATNYIMLEYGQPLHAFDAAKVSDGRIVVRTARVGEKLVTLDAQTRGLDPSMLVIADPRGPTALAGIMGGRDSEVSDATKDIIIEAAIFDSISIRRTSRKLGLVSEASKRFERGLWQSLPEEASEAASSFIVELCGGTLEQGSVRVGGVKSKSKIITFNPKYVKERLGTNIAAAKSKATLGKLGFKVAGSKSWKVTVPEWRLDATVPEDLVDEVGRMVGYEHLLESWPTAPSIPKPLPFSLVLKDQLRDTLARLGFLEVITHTYYGGDESSNAGDRNAHVRVANPLDQTQQYLRLSLKPGIRRILMSAADAGHDTRIFEVGRVFGKEMKLQPWILALGRCHKTGGGLGLEEDLRLFQEALGVTGLLRPIAHDQMKGRDLEWVEFNLDDINQGWGPKKYQARSKFPSVKRDISLWIPRRLSAPSIHETLRRLGGGLLTTIRKIDQFQQGQQQSLTFELIFQSPDRTLMKAEVDKLEATIKDGLVKLGATIR